MEANSPERPIAVDGSNYRDRNCHCSARRGATYETRFVTNKSRWLTRRSRKFETGSNVESVDFTTPEVTGSFLNSFIARAHNNLARCLYIAPT